MDRTSVDWKGYWPASPTPFKRSGEFDEESFRKLLQIYLRHGSHGILINGSSGEWFSQTLTERQHVAAIAVEELGGKIPVIVGCSSVSYTETIELGQHAQKIGADGILCTPPPYMRPSDDDTLNFYQTVSDQVQLPLMVYNIPRRVGTNIDTALTVRLARISNIVALKDSSPEPQFYQTLPAISDRLRVFSGVFLSPLGMAALSAMGGDGYIGGWELLGSELPEFFNAFWARDVGRAQEIGLKEKTLDRQLWNDANQPQFGRSFNSQLKAATGLIGQPTGYPRLPLLPLDDSAQLAGLRRVIESAGLETHQPSEAVVR